MLSAFLPLICQMLMKQMRRRIVLTTASFISIHGMSRSLHAASRLSCSHRKKPVPGTHLGIDVRNGRYSRIVEPSMRNATFSCAFSKTAIFSSLASAILRPCAALQLAVPTALRACESTRSGRHCWPLTIGCVHKPHQDYLEVLIIVGAHPLPVQDVTQEERSGGNTPKMPVGAVATSARKA